MQKIDLGPYAHDRRLVVHEEGQAELLDQGPDWPVRVVPAGEWYRVFQPRPHGREVYADSAADGLAQLIGPVAA